MFADKILKNFNQIFCPEDKNRPLKGLEMSKCNILKNGFIAIKDEKILKIGINNEFENLIGPYTEIIDYFGKIAVPGLIDCHTHLVYGGSREHEFTQKLSGISYLDILKNNGGINNTVNSTRLSTFDELFQKSKNLLDIMLLHGVTFVEAKSGYGLDKENELKQMEVVKKLNEIHYIDLVSTFMGAHVIPKEFKNDSNKYIKFLIDFLPEIKNKKLAEFCDVFCEEGVFSANDSKKILVNAKKNGFKLRIHTNEIKNIGGIDVAIELNVHSAEHLMQVTDDDIRKLSNNNIICNLLPATTFSLMGKKYAPAKKMIKNGVIITLASDSNPGSCPTANLQFVMQLGCYMLGLTPIQVLNAVTINAAYSINKQKNIGSFDIGKKADISIFNAPNIDYIFYFFATNLIYDVYKNGKLVVSDNKIMLY